MSVSIKYKGNEIAKLTATGTKTLNTAGKYCEGNIIVENTEQSQQAVEQATPSLSVNNATGVVTAEATQEAGNVAAGTKKASLQLPTQGAKTVTPSAARQTAVASGKYTTGNVEVAAVPTEAKTVELSMPSGNQTVSPSSGKFLSVVTVKKPATMLPENIKKGVNIGGVVGALESGEALGDPTTLTVGFEGNSVPDAVIIAQQSSNLYKVYVGLADGGIDIDTVVGGMVFIASPTTPLAIVNGEGVSMDYVTETTGGSVFDPYSLSTVKVVKITETYGSIAIGLG
nr:MAG TPA: tail protein [Caudoviricetes sp.]